MQDYNSYHIHFYAVVVVYNICVYNSLTLNNLKNINKNNVSVIVVDNSTENFNNGSLAEKSGWTYMSMNGNVGLSKAYNRALDLIQDKDGVVIWLDDDTNITREYFDVLEKDVLENCQIDIFAPVIQGQDGKYLSPNEYHFLRNKQLKNKDDSIDCLRFNAINSCTAVRMRVYEKYRYTVQLFLDQVDHQFFEDQRNIGRTFKKMDVVIQHNLSIKNKVSNIEKMKNRYSIMIPDFLWFCRKSTTRYILGWMKVIGWGIKESIKLRNVYFFFWCIFTGLKNRRGYIKEDKTQ
ncbi:Glycosyltransferase, GT2 family [Selenomonas ruminantium]|uniref:Glycosyltransferase, GT2 family n=1 Tax=Selenomonas ruminantium TaxID=971 RepID=A0A1M6X418_SELRU|nr:glycosyltransferase [Selenomonas ruminantium]SHL00757.1 Glycosyltransferase, GT2 family [Selenomonas ruminantium]